jgi:hypothetical protein
MAADLQSMVQFSLTEEGTKIFGEHNDDGKPSGSVVCLSKSGGILLEYQKYGESDAGNYIDINRNGFFRVGTRYVDDEGNK